MIRIQLGKLSALHREIHGQDDAQLEEDYNELSQTKKEAASPYAGSSS